MSIGQEVGRELGKALSLTMEPLREQIASLHRELAEVKERLEKAEQERDALAATLDHLLSAARELREVMQLRGEDAYLSPPDDPLLWTARRNDAYGELYTAIDSTENPSNILAAVRRPLVEALKRIVDLERGTCTTCEGSGFQRNGSLCPGCWGEGCTEHSAKVTQVALAAIPKEG